MQFRNSTFFAFLLVLCTATPLSAQGLIDGFFSQKGEGSVSLSYIRSSFEEFYAGEMKMPMVPAHNSIDQDIINVYGTYGITNNLGVVLNVPYFAARGNGAADPVNGLTQVDGLQDISLALKLRPFSAGIGENGSLDGILAAGVSVAGNYEANGILSIGHGANTTDLTGGLQYNTGSGLYVTGLFNYSLRGEAENSGTGPDFDVPNATHLTGKIGYAASKFFVEAWVRNQTTSDEGIDITDADFGGRFPLTKVDFTMLGGSVYVPVGSVLGLSASFGTLLDGRNVGGATYFGAGATFNFGGFTK